MSEISFAYGINAVGLSGEQQIGLLANLEALKARDRIERNDFEGLNYQGVFELYLTAYGDKRLAQQAQTAFLEAKVRNACNAAMG